ncbi:MAG: hypothetical protein ACI4V0_08660 [Lachnospiraceae bacterium]
MKKQMIILLMITIFVLTSNVPVLAATVNTITPYAYRDELLVSYKEYWYYDGRGERIHVIYGRQYKPYTFVNGYRQLTPIITSLPDDMEGLPSGAFSHHYVQLRYEFY